MHGLSGRLLAVVRAAAARNAVVFHDLTIKVVLRLDNTTKENPPVHAGVGALGLVVGIMNLSGWVRVGCARLCGGHEAIPSWSGLRGALTPAGPFPLSEPITHPWLTPHNPIR
jgi:hypothetical protein